MSFQRKIFKNEDQTAELTKFTESEHSKQLQKSPDTARQEEQIFSSSGRKLVLLIFYLTISHRYQITQGKKKKKHARIGIGVSMDLMRNSIVITL